MPNALRRLRQAVMTTAAAAGQPSAGHEPAVRRSSDGDYQRSGRRCECVCADRPRLAVGVWV